MDPEFINNLVETLRKVTAPDTAAIQEASQVLQNNFYKSEIIVPALVSILQTHPEVQIRQLAGVEARKLIDFRWEDLPENLKLNVKSNLLQTTMAEPESLVRHTSSRVISTIGKKELNRNSWPELLNSLSAYIRSSNVSEREVSVYVLYTLLEADLGVMSDHITDLLAVFSESINDPESLQVRVSTIMALGEISSVLSSVAQDEQSSKDVEIFRSTVPSMVNVLKQVIEANDEKAASQIFEVFSFLLIVDSNLTAKYFGDLISFILVNIAANNQLSEEMRVPAIQYLINAVRSKKMKIQSLKLGPQLCATAMNIVANYYEENEEDLDEEDESELSETNPGTLSLQLIDNMSSTLPPTQVNTTLLHTLDEFVKSGSSVKARAGFMSLAYALEGAPDFFASQIQHILPLVILGLQQPDQHIRCAALFALYYLGCELRELISEEHETLLPLVFNIMEHATTLKVGKNAFQALDSILECMDRRVITEKYLDTLVPKLLSLFSGTSNVSLKALISTTISSTAFSAGKNFLPFFETTMHILEPYIALGQNIETLSQPQADLCASALDTVGSIAASVGTEAFRPYVEALVDSAYKCMQAKSTRARESSFICVGTLAKIYGQEFAPIVPKLINELYSSLDQDEFADLPDDVDDMGMEDDEENIMSKFEASSAIAIEKEYATQALSDLVQACKTDFPDIKKAIHYFSSQTQYYSEGLRKASISGLWHAYTTWVSVDNEAKWTPGLPAPEHANPVTAFIAEVTRGETIDLLENEEDRDVVIYICRRLAEGLKVIGPRVLLDSERLDRLSAQISLILEKQHRCQFGVEDEIPEENDADDTEISEYDGLLIDSTFDIVVQLAACLGSQFTPLFPKFFEPIAKFCASSAATERAAAVGALAEIISGMGSNVTSFTDDFMQILLRSIRDKNIEVRSNAAYGLGLLCFFSEDASKTLAQYPTILDRLQNLLKKVDKATARGISINNCDSDDNNARCLSNACGCVARMILKHPQNVPVSDVVKVLIHRLPLIEGLEENTPVFELFVELFRGQEPTVLEHRAQIVEIFSRVFAQESTAKADLANITTGINEIELPFETDEIRNKIIELLKFLETQQSGLVSSHANLAALLA